MVFRRVLKWLDFGRYKSKSPHSLTEQQDITAQYEALPASKHADRLNLIVWNAWKYTDHKDSPCPIFLASPNDDGTVMARWANEAETYTTPFWFFDDNGKAYYKADKSDDKYTKGADGRSYLYDMEEPNELIYAATLVLNQAVGVDMRALALDVIDHVNEHYQSDEGDFLAETNIETISAIDDLTFILSRDKDDDYTDEEYKEHCNTWIAYSEIQLKKELTQHLIENEVYEEEYLADAALAAKEGLPDDAAQTEEEFLARIDFHLVYRYLHEEWTPGVPYNG